MLHSRCPQPDSGFAGGDNFAGPHRALGDEVSCHQGRDALHRGHDGTDGDNDSGEHRPSGLRFRAGQWGEEACEVYKEDGSQGRKGRREVPEVWGKDGLKEWEKRALLGLQQVSEM